MARKEDESLKDLRKQMELLRKERQKNFTGRKEQPEHQVTRENVHQCIKSVVDAFVDGDKSLLLQSSDPYGFYVSYGLHRGCMVQISDVAENHVSIQMQNDSGDAFAIYTGSVSKDSIQSSVKNALITWYSNLF